MKHPTAGPGATPPAEDHMEPQNHWVVIEENGLLSVNSQVPWGPLWGTSMCDWSMGRGAVAVAAGWSRKTWRMLSASWTEQSGARSGREGAVDARKSHIRRGKIEIKINVDDHFTKSSKARNPKKLDQHSLF